MHKKFGIGLAGITTLIVGAVFALAHGREKAESDLGFPPPVLVEKIATQLGLDDGQKTQAKRVLDEAKTRVEPLIKSMQENRLQIRDLGTDGNFDETKVNQIADTQAEIMKQLFLEKEKTKAQLFAILTPEQREKAKQMQEKFIGKMKGRLGRFF